MEEYFIKKPDFFFMSLRKYVIKHKKEGGRFVRSNVLRKFAEALKIFVLIHGKERLLIDW